MSLIPVSTTTENPKYKKAAYIAGGTALGVGAATCAAYIKGKSLAPNDTFVKQTAKGYECAWDKARGAFDKMFQNPNDKTVSEGSNIVSTTNTTTTGQISFIEKNGQTEVIVNGKKITDEKEIEKYIKMKDSLTGLGEQIRDLSTTIPEDSKTTTTLFINGRQITDEKEIEKYNKIIEEAFKKAK